MTASAVGSEVVSTTSHVSKKSCSSFVFEFWFAVVEANPLLSNESHFLAVEKVEVERMCSLLIPHRDRIVMMC